MKEGDSWLLEFYILATSMVISGLVSTCDSMHSWRLYSAAIRSISRESVCLSGEIFSLSQIYVDPLAYHIASKIRWNGAGQPVWHLLIGTILRIHFLYWKQAEPNEVRLVIRISYIGILLFW